MSITLSNKIRKLANTDFAHAKLQSIPYAPKTLFQIGEIVDQPMVSIIGSRKHTNYGKYAAEHIAGELARQGVAIVSGLALGIDSIAHRAALRAGGITHAVLPTGLKSIYPSSHRNLAIEIIQHSGALISEFAPNQTKAYKQNFIQRNRIVSGLGDVLIVIEASQRSGTLHTVNFALEQGREVFAVPGPINSPSSAGTNLLIQNGAQLLHDPAQIMEYLQIKQAHHPKVEIKFDDESQRTIYGLLGEEQMLHADVLLIHSELTAQEFNQALTMLEIYGHIKCIGNNTWTKS